MFTVGLWFPVTVHQPVGDRLAVALVLGTVAAASSPVVNMALIGELEARGPVARTVLAVTVAQEVAVIVLLALRSEEHTSELQSLAYLVCRLLLEKKKEKEHKLDAKT